MIRFIFCVIALGLVPATGVAQFQASIACEGCSRATEEACAVAVARQLGLPDGGYVNVWDVPDAEITRYGLTVSPDGTELRGARSAQRSSTIHAAPEPVPPDAAATAAEFMEVMRDVVRPVGGAQPFLECLDSGRGAVTIESRPRAMRELPHAMRDIDSNDLAILWPTPVTVPGDVMPSAFETDVLVISRLGPWLRSNFPVLDFLAVTYTAVFEVIGLFGPVPIDVKVFVQVEFEDGSRGFVFLSGDLGGAEWEVELDLLFDSDGNPIPVRPERVPERFEFSGQPPGERNLERQLERLGRLGIPINDTRPGPSPGGTMDCNPSGNGVTTCVLRSN